MLTVYSTEGSPGASTTAMHLASRWASAGREVLLVELDPAGGSLSHNLGIQFTPGSASFVASGMPVLSNHLIDHAQDVLFENLHVMPAPASPTGARGIFSTFADFALDLRAISENELAVVIDGGRLRAETAASALTTEAAGVALVCRSTSQLSDLDDLAEVLAASSGHGPQGLAVSVGKPPMDPDEWREAHGLDFCGAIEIVPGVANDLSAYLARGKRRSKKWQNSLDKVAEKLYPYAQPPPSGATQRGRSAVTTGTDAAEGSDAPDSESAPTEASAGHEQAPAGPAPDHTMPKAPVPVAGYDQPHHPPTATEPQPGHEPHYLPSGHDQPAPYGHGPYPAQPHEQPQPGHEPWPAYDQPQPGHEPHYQPTGHEPRPPYDQPHYLPPTTGAGGYGQAPPPATPEGYPGHDQPAPYGHGPYPAQPHEQPQPGHEPWPAYDQPQPGHEPHYQPTGHEPRPPYDQPHYLPPTTGAGGYGQAPPPATPEGYPGHDQPAPYGHGPYPAQPHDQPQSHYDPAPPAPGDQPHPATMPPQAAAPHQQTPHDQAPPAPGDPPHPATMPPQAAEPETQPRPDIKPTGSFRDWARKLHGSDAADVTARRGG